MIGERDLLRHLEDGGDDVWNRPDPPAIDLAAITGGLDAAPAGNPAPAPAPRRARWRLPALALPSLGLAAGALACVAIGLGIGAVVFGGDPAAPPQPQVQASSPSPSGVAGRPVALRRLGSTPTSAMAVATVFSTGDGKSLDVRVAGLPPLHDGSFYELWALGTKGRMVSLGTIPIDANGNGEASFQVPVSLTRFPVLDISLEHADGDPTHSGDSLLRAPV